MLKKRFIEGEYRASARKKERARERGALGPPLTSERMTDRARGRWCYLDSDPVRFFIPPPLGIPLQAPLLTELASASVRVKGVNFFDARFLLLTPSWKILPCLSLVRDNYSTDRFVSKIQSVPIPPTSKVNGQRLVLCFLFYLEQKNHRSQLQQRILSMEFFPLWNVVFLFTQQIPEVMKRLFA